MIILKVIIKERKKTFSSYLRESFWKVWESENFMPPKAWDATEFSFNLHIGPDFCKATHFIIETVLLFS